jgi:hypothetical protein
MMNFSASGKLKFTILTDLEVNFFFLNEHDYIERISETFGFISFLFVYSFGCAGFILIVHGLDMYAFSIDPLFLERDIAKDAFCIHFYICRRNDCPRRYLEFLE